MNLIEKKMNLFDADSKYYLAQCISADAGSDSRSMNLGIVLEFNKRYHMKSKIQAYRKINTILVGDCIFIDKVFNLITKSKYYGKPTYTTLYKSLVNMKMEIMKNNIKYLAIPKLGCGLDKLSYGKVKEMIMNLFKEIDIEILVCKN